MTGQATGSAARHKGWPKPALLYNTMRKRFGFLDWWPGETKDEVLIGAILTQQTSWKNVEKAIANLKNAGAISLRGIARMRKDRIEALIRPSGFYRQKAKRLKETCAYIYRNYGSLDKFFSRDKEALREELLGLNGIGNETADSIILYAAEKPAFVIDEYTRRVMGRVSGIYAGNKSYEEIQDFFEKGLERDVALYKEAHAQFVELGKNYCRAKPLCAGCPLEKICLYGSKIRIGTRPPRTRKHNA